MGFMGKFGDAIIGGVGTLGGAALQARATNKATAAAERGNQAALAYQKEQDAYSRAENLRREALWQKQYNDWTNMRNAALERYGFSGRFTPLSGYGPQMGSATAAPGGAMMRQAPRSGPVHMSPYADAVGGQEAPYGGSYRGQEGMEGVPEDRGVYDWRRYGLE